MPCTPGANYFVVKESGGTGKRGAEGLGLLFQIMFEFADTLLSTGRTPLRYSAPIASKPEAAYLKASEVPLSLKFP